MSIYLKRWWKNYGTWGWFRADRFTCLVIGHWDIYMLCTTLGLLYSWTYRLILLSSLSWFGRVIRSAVDYVSTCPVWQLNWDCPVVPEPSYELSLNFSFSKERYLASSIIVVLPRERKGFASFIPYEPFLWSDFPSSMSQRIYESLSLQQFSVDIAFLVWKEN